MSKEPRKTPTILMDKLPTKGQRIGIPSTPDSLFKVQALKKNGKTVLKHMKTGARIVVMLVLKPRDPKMEYKNGVYRTNGT